MRMPSSWLHQSCDSLARSVFFRFRFCQPLSSPPRSPKALLAFSPLMFSVWRVPVSFLSCWGSWLGSAVVLVLGALFQSRGWLPIVEVRGYSRHPTSILTMQLLTSCNRWFYVLNLFMKLLTMIERSNKSYWAALSGFQWYCLLCCIKVLRTVETVDEIVNSVMRAHSRHVHHGSDHEIWRESADTALLRKK